MLLSSLILPNKGQNIRGKDCEIIGITADSRKVKPGFLFAAIPGTSKDGRNFIADALAKGAVAVLIPENGSEEFSKVINTVTIVTSSDVRSALSSIAARFYAKQPENIAAVTGTSGKTSIVQFTREIWTANGHNAASIGTLGYITATEKLYGSLTTPDAVELHQILDQAASKGISHLAMEASSHGLDLHRLDNVRVKVAAFTNLSRDHLDYHDSMESYLKAKMRLFTEVMNEGETAVLNADAPEFEELAKICKERKHKVISFGKKGREIRLLESKPKLDGQLMRFSTENKTYEVNLPVVGSFQAWNSLCALGIAIGSGDNVEKSATALEKISGVPGRMEYIGTSAKGGAVFVDYAHKPGALENVLLAMREHIAASPGAKLHVVFGCGGNRDRGKRPQMGTIAQRLADVVIVTDDNPRYENPDEIRREILAGCNPGPNLREISGRAEAIHTAIAGLGKNDILVIAGKGHETGQIVGDKILPFDDAEVAREALQDKIA